MTPIDPFSILVLCEDQEERALLTAELELIGYWGRVRACDSAQEARLLAARQAPGLFIARVTDDAPLLLAELQPTAVFGDAIIVQGAQPLALHFAEHVFLSIPYGIDELIAAIRSTGRGDPSADAMVRGQVTRLGEEERKYKDLFDRASDAILLIDYLTHTIIDANLRAAEMYGYARNELIGMNLLQIVPRDEYLSVWRNTQQMETADHGQIIEIFDRRHVRKDGSTMQVAISAALIEYGGRKVFQDIVRDETARILSQDSNRSLPYAAAGMAGSAGNALNVTRHWHKLIGGPRNRLRVRRAQGKVCIPLIRM